MSGRGRNVCALGMGCTDDECYKWHPGDLASDWHGNGGTTKSSSPAGATGTIRPPRTVLRQAKDQTTQRVCPRGLVCADSSCVLLHPDYAGYDRAVQRQRGVVEAPPSNSSKSGAALAMRSAVSRSGPDSSDALPSGASEGDLHDS